MRLECRGRLATRRNDMNVAHDAHAEDYHYRSETLTKSGCGQEDSGLATLGWLFTAGKLAAWQSRPKTAQGASGYAVLRMYFYLWVLSRCYRSLYVEIPVVVFGTPGEVVPAHCAKHTFVELGRLLSHLSRFYIIHM